MKYVVTKDGAIVFSEGIVHAHVARGMVVLGAGFCSIEPELEKSENLVARCFGKSISLGIKSRGREDEEIINRTMLS